MILRVLQHNEISDRVSQYGNRREINRSLCDATSPRVLVIRLPETGSEQTARSQQVSFVFGPSFDESDSRIVLN